MTCTLMTWPIRPAASAPASMAAFTAATSPFTNAVTMPLPALSQPIISTFAAFSIASVPSIRATNPLHSSKPSASIAINISFHSCPAQPDLLCEFHKCRCFQIARIAFIGVDVHFENDFGVIAHLHAVEGHAAGAGDAELHIVGVFHAVIVHVGGAHVHVALGADD